jgi:cell division protease FtsH
MEGRRREPLPKNNAKSFVPYALVLLSVIMIFALSYMMPLMGRKDTRIDYSQFLEKVRDNEVQVLLISAYNVYGLGKDSQIPEESFAKNYVSLNDFKLQVPNDIASFNRDLLDATARGLGKSPGEVSSLDFRFTYINEPVPQEPIWLTLLPSIILVGAVIFVMMMFMRQQAGSNSKMMSFGKSKARTLDERNKVTFAQVAGADEEKEELREIVEFLKNPGRFTDLGARIPKGVLLVGPPGTGKTLLAKAVAGEAGVPFYSISGSDFVEMFVGVGASRVRDLFETAKKNSPSIVFIDEIDAVGRQRGAGLGGGHDEREQTLNQLLVEMDGFSANEGVIVIAATNRPDILDKALLRPGRFDRQITVGYPDVKGREEILRVHSKGKPLAPEVSLHVLASRTTYMTGADLENVMNEAAILTARASKKIIGMQELEEAITRVQVGPEKKSHVITERDKRLVAYHEAGHALIAHLLPNSDPVHEVSIVPRGQAGGYTMTRPEEEKHYMSGSVLRDRVVEMMGGHTAEKVVLGDVSTGATSDLSRASELARAMVTEYGMSESIGPVYLGGGQEVFVGRDFGHARNYSEQLAAKVDDAIHGILGDAAQKAEELLLSHRSELDAIAEALLEKEKLDRDEFLRVMGAYLPLQEDKPSEDLEKPRGGMIGRIQPEV